MASSSLVCSCCVVKILFEQPMEAVCDVKVQGCHNIPCSNCFLKFKEHHCVPLDADAHLIFNSIMRTKLEGHMEKFLQQRGWFLDDVEEAFTRIFKSDRTQNQSRTSPAAELADWPENMPVFISLPTPTDDAMANSSNNTHLQIVEFVTCSEKEDDDVDDLVSQSARTASWSDEHTPRSPVTYAYPHLVTDNDDDPLPEGSDYSGGSYYSNHSGHPNEDYGSDDYGLASGSESVFEEEQREDWAYYEHSTRSLTRPRNTILGEFKRTFYGLLNGIHIR